MFKPKRAGDSIAYQHQDWNAAMRAARAHRDSVLTGGTVEALPSWGQYERLSIKNKSGAARARFDILGIDGVIFEPESGDEVFENGPVLEGITPATASHLQGQFAILLQPADVDEIVDGLLIGVTPARVDITLATHGYADITDGQAGYLTSGVSGSAKIVWKPSGTGQNMCLVKMGTITGITVYPATWCCKIMEDNPNTSYGQTTHVDMERRWNTGRTDAIVKFDSPVPADAILLATVVSLEEFGYRNRTVIAAGNQRRVLLYINWIYETFDVNDITWNQAGALSVSGNSILATLNMIAGAVAIPIDTQVYQDQGQYPGTRREYDTHDLTTTYGFRAWLELLDDAQADYNWVGARLRCQFGNRRGTFGVRYDSTIFDV